MYTKKDVLNIVDACFHKYASDFRIDAKEHALDIMAESDFSNKNKYIDYMETECHCRGDKYCIFCNQPMVNNT